ncbi:transposase [Streptomyces arboris]|uniref:Transposase n=1 Tax=Streptomyces arboris TaxID=2600619 RepID=A0A5N5EAK7_9ACTN|nr:transposase [Streptomyces arboris]
MCFVHDGEVERGHLRTGSPVRDRLSVGRTGQCWDNALAESFFSTIKRELLGTSAWPSRAAAHTAIFDFIEGWYNLHRQPRLSQPRRVRDCTRSLTTTPMVSVKAEQAQAEQASHCDAEAGELREVACCAERPER